MEQLRQVARGFGILFFCLVSTTVNVAAQNVCSLTVRALAPDGRRGRFGSRSKRRMVTKRKKCKEMKMCSFATWASCPSRSPWATPAPVTKSPFTDVPRLLGAALSAQGRPMIHKPAISGSRFHPRCPSANSCFAFPTRKATGYRALLSSCPTPVPGTVKLVGKLGTDRYGRAHLIAARGDSVVGSVSANGFPVRGIRFCVFREMAGTLATAREREVAGSAEVAAVWLPLRFLT